MSKIMEIRIVTKDGEISELSPVLKITVDNGYHEYEFAPEDIETIELYETTVGEEGENIYNA